jgi:hypothetical protein
MLIQPLQLFWPSEKGVCTRWRATDGSWSTEQNLGGTVSSLSTHGVAASVVQTAATGPDILQLFYWGTQDQIVTRWREPDGSWSAEQSLGGTVLEWGPITAAFVP